MRDKMHREYIKIDSSFGRIKGFIDKDAPNVAQFLGIPFAEPPVGPLRWKPPVPKSKLDTFDATEFGPSCPQVVTYHQSVYNTECREHRITDDTSEDCLSICIWAPASVVRDPSSKPLPVIVWITGGAFLVGGSTIPYQNPTPWVESSQRHIVVCINYRLNIFGFPNAAGLPDDKQNLGLFDQRLGLEWVHTHISSFGGDPDRLTHFGQSAGGRSVDLHAFWYPDKPLVRNLIMNSGTALPPFPGKDPEHTQFSFVAKALGFPGGDAADELEFMRSQPAEEIIKYQVHHYATKNPFFLRFQPVVDGISVFDDYEARTREGKFSRLPAIIGTTADEGNSLVMPYSPDGCNKEESERMTVNYFLKPSIRTERARSAHAPTFRYLFRDPAPPGSSAFPNISPKPWHRAYHCADMPLVFGTHEIARGPSTPLERAVSKAWQDFYVAFAEEGPDGLKRKGWKDVSEGEGVVFGPGENGWEPVQLKEIEPEEV